MSTVGPEFEIASECAEDGNDESVELDIPEDGLTQDGWSITPLSHPSVGLPLQNKLSDFIQ